jgi:ubiquinone/menaquinone biosynthesis C-methylase UbiE
MNRASTKQTGISRLLNKESLLRQGIVTLMILYVGGCHFTNRANALSPQEDRARREALRMIKASQGTLAPVYEPLAQQISKDFQLSEKTGIGIDIGSGPGTLIIELCKCTKLHWINADINPYFFGYFHKMAAKNDIEHRVSSVLADVHDLPFRSNYADFIVSRGSYRFWDNKVKAFGEIYRVLKPGAVAYIGRGFSRNLPVETAKRIRAKQGWKMNYDIEEKAKELRLLMKQLDIKEYRIHKPGTGHSEKVNYGIWIEFRKPDNAEHRKGLN